MKNFIIPLFMTVVLMTGVYPQTAYQNEIAKWRLGHETELKKEDGWFSLAGLFWLREGVNTIGSGAEYDVRLTKNFEGRKFGEIHFDKGVATLKVERGAEAFTDGKQISEIVLNTDEHQKQTVIQTGSQTFYVIKREDRFGVRLKDKNTPSRLNFKGLYWFSVDPKYKVTATFEPFPEPKEILIPNTVGSGYRMKSEGVLKFRLLGKSYSLQPAEENGRYFIIFRDLTSKNETYGVGRFLYAEKSKDNKVILDFNKAENPPCAYTSFATCPIPPPRNRLKVAIRAGEKRYHD